MKADIISEILGTDLSENTKTNLINSLSERFLIKPFTSAIKPGDSKIGGFPHLPPDFQYPQGEKYIYEFVAQINLTDFANSDTPVFPAGGMLYFFIDDDFNVSDIPAKVLMLNTAGADLEIRQPPQGKESRCESFPGRTAATEQKLEITKAYTFDQDLLGEVENELVATSGGFDLERFYTRDQFWGYTGAWGGINGQWSAYLSKRRLKGLYWLTSDDQIKHLKDQQIDRKQWLHKKIDEKIIKQKEILSKNDPSAYIYPYWEQELLDLEHARLQLDAFADDLEFHKEESRKWRMLLSLSSNIEANIRFGDGRMEFYINSEDLRDLNFDNIYCHIY